MTTNRGKAYIYTLTAVLLWSTVATAFKIGLRFMNSGSLLLFSSAFSSIALGIMLLIRRRPLPCPGRVMIKGAALGLINPFIYYLFLFKAYALLPAQEAQPLNFTWPIVLVLLSVLFLREPMTLRDFASLLICFTGAWVVSSHGRFSNIRFTSVTGTALALGSSLFWSIYWILNRVYRGDKTALLFFSFLSGTLYTAAFLLLTGGITVPETGGLAACLYIGLFEMGITFLIWSKALEYAESAVFISNIIYIAPFLSLIFISLILGETIAFSTVIGLSLIVLGILLQKIRKG